MGGVFFLDGIQCRLPVNGFNLLCQRRRAGHIWSQVFAKDERRQLFVKHSPSKNRRKIKIYRYAKINYHKKIDRVVLLAAYCVVYNTPRGSMGLPELLWCYFKHGSCPGPPICYACTHRSNGHDWYRRRYVFLQYKEAFGNACFRRN